MQNSQKSKGRKPIFTKKQKNLDSDHERLYQTTASFFTQSQTMPMKVTQTVQPIRNSLINHSNSVSKTIIPMQIRVYSPNKIVNQQNINTIVSRPLTPQMQQNPVYILNPGIQHPVASVPFYKTQPQFFQNPGLLKVSSKCMSRYQGPSITEKVVRTNELKPTVVEIERVMKPIGQNQLPQESIFKTLQNTSYVHHIVEPERIKVYNQVQRKSGQYAQKIQKLQEINGILSRNYDALLDEVQFLKQEQYVQEDALDENKFIRKAANLFQNLLNVQMHRALNEIDQVHKVEKRCISNYRKSHADSFFR